MTEIAKAVAKSGKINNFLLSSVDFREEQLENLLHTVKYSSSGEEQKITEQTAGCQSYNQH